MGIVTKKESRFGRLRHLRLDLWVLGAGAGAASIVDAPAGILFFLAAISSQSLSGAV